MGPLTPQMKGLAVKRQGDIKYPIKWTTLGQYLEFLRAQGRRRRTSLRSSARRRCASTNLAKGCRSDPGATRRMRALVRQAMKEGALGVGTALIYPPATYAETPELIALVSEAGKCGGMYISHMRSEGNKLLESDRRAGQDQPRFRGAGRNLSFQTGRKVQLGQARRSHRKGRCGARIRAADHREYVHLYGGRDRA